MADSLFEFFTGQKTLGDYRKAQAADEQENLARQRIQSVVNGYNKPDAQSMDLVQNEGNAPGGPNIDMGGLKRMMFGFNTERVADEQRPYSQRPQVAKAQFMRDYAMIDPVAAFNMTKQQMFPEKGDPYTLNPGDVRFGGDNTPIAMAPALPSKPDIGLVYDPDSPTGASYGPKVPGAIAPPSSGMSIKADGKGGFELVQGRGAGMLGQGDMTTGTRSTIEGKQFQAANALSRLRGIQQAYRPEFLTFGAKTAALGLNLKDKLDPNSLSEEQRNYLVDHSAFMRRSIENVNVTLNDLSGAAVSPSEEERLRGAIPDPGSPGNPLSGDGPTKFSAKMDDIIQAQQEAIMRYSYATANGLDPLETGIDVIGGDGKPTGAIYDIMAQREDTIKQQVKQQNPQISEAALDKLVEEQLLLEFGLAGMAN